MRAAWRRGARIVTELRLCMTVEKYMAECPVAAGSFQLCRITRRVKLDARRTAEKCDQLQEIFTGRVKLTAWQWCGGTDQSEVLKPFGKDLDRYPKAGVFRV